MSCPICLDTLESNEIVNVNCGHSFHQKCIEQWVNSNFSCPYCRKDLYVITHITKDVVKSINYEFKKKTKNKNVTINNEIIYDSYYQLINQSPCGFLQNDSIIYPIYLLQTTNKYYITYYLRQIILWNKIDASKIVCFNDDFGRTIYHTNQTIYNQLNNTNCNLMYTWIHQIMSSLSFTYLFCFTVDMNSIILDLCVNTIKKLRLPKEKFQTAIIVSIYQILKYQKMYNYPTENLTIDILIDYTDNSSNLEDFNKYMFFQNKYIKKNIKIL